MPVKSLPHWPLSSVVFVSEAGVRSGRPVDEHIHCISLCVQVA